MLNDVLEEVGAKIRFNDDQLCDPNDNIGPPWRFFVSKFPTPEITGKEVKRLLTRSACSLLNDKYKALKGNTSLKIVACSKKGSYNTEADKLDDGFLYASGTSEIPLAAVEDLGRGRVAAIGEQFYIDVFYSNPSDLSTIEFNRNIISWLGASRAKTLKQMFMMAASLDGEDNLEIRADKFNQLSKDILDQIRAKVESDPAELYNIKEMIDEHEGESMEKIRRMFNQMIMFEQLHQK
jgi:hypothetical protein